jgi:hypothetical protein
VVHFETYVPNTPIANVTKLGGAFLHIVDDTKTNNSLFLCIFNLMFGVLNQSNGDYILSGCSKSVKLKIQLTESVYFLRMDLL